MGQYQIFVGADTKSATNSLNTLNKVVETVTKAKELKIKFPNTKTFERNIRNATKYASNGIKQLVNNTEGLRDAFSNVKAVADPRSFLTGSFAGANIGAQTLLDKLAKISIALYGLNSAAGILKNTFGAFYSTTIGQANRFEESLLKTKTTLASTSDVFVNGKKVTDPLEAIKALTGVIDERVESIRLRTIDLAGVTSGEVVEVFGIVASQAGQIGASISEAEDLAISFAAALGTFGLPLRQARQEITSILQGNINVDSYIAKALDISSADIQKARSQIGGITKYLQDKLQTAVAGQSLAAKTLAGVLSNVRDVWEEFTRAIGSAQLNPLIGAVTVFYEGLKDSLETIKSIGFEFGKLVTIVGRGASNAAGLGGFDQSRMQAMQQGAAQLLQSINAGIKALNVGLADLFTGIQGQLAFIFENVGAQVAMVGDAFAELGKAVLVLTSVQIESFVGAIAQLIPILTGAIAGVSSLIQAWAEFLKMPIVQAFVRFKTTLKVLEATGVKAIVMLIAKLVIFRRAIIATVKSVWAGVTTVMRGIGLVLKAIGTVIIAITRVMRQVAVLGVKLGLVSKKSALDIKKMALEMQGLGVQAQATGMKMGLLSKGVWAVVTAFKGLLKTTIILALVEAALVGIVELINLIQRKQAEAASDRRLKRAITTLDETAEKAANGGLSSLEQKLRDIANLEVQKKLDKLAEEIDKIDDRIQNLKEDPFANYGEFNFEDPQSLIDAEYEKRKKKEKEFNELQKKLQIDNVKDDVETRAKEGKKLEKELAEFRKKLADDEFRYRQRLATAEVDRFRAQSQLEVQRMSAILKARLEGEEGSSRIYMERLNDYLLAKKRGEDDIAERQKRLQITLANMQKEIADYKYNTEKKIAELQKKMGKYQMDVANHKLQKAREEAKAESVEGGGTYTQGNIGPTSTGPHFDIKRTDGKYFDRAALDKYVSVNGGALSAGTTVPGGEFGAPRSYGKHAGWDYAFGDGAELNLKDGAEFVSNSETQHGDATIFMTPDGTKYQILHGKFKSAPKADVAPAPEAPDLDLGAVDPSKVTSSLQETKRLLQDITALQAEMTQEGLAQQFTDLAKGVFGEINLEPLEDQLTQASALFDATADNAERLNKSSQAEIANQTELTRLKIELDQIIQTINETSELGDETKLRLTTFITDEHAKYVASLKAAQDKKTEILAITEAQLALEQALTETRAIEEATADNMLRMRMEMEGFSQVEIDAALKKEAIYRRMAKALEDLDPTKDVDKINTVKAAYQGLFDAIDAAAKVQMKMQNPVRQLMAEWKKDLQDVNGYYAEMAQVVQTQLGQAMSSALTGIIDGTKTAQEAFADMFKNIGKAFIDMATQMIAKALIMKVLGIFLPGAGGFNMGTTALGAGGGSVGGIGTLGPNFGFQTGAAQGAYINTATPALIGEGGAPEYVIPENKMASSMQRWAMGMRGDGVVKGADSSFGSQNRSQAQPTALGDVSKRFNPGNNYSNTNNYGTDGSASDNFSINITGEQLVFNEKNYVSQDQIPGIVQQAAKQGEGRTLRKMRMSQSTRQRSGL